VLVKVAEATQLLNYHHSAQQSMYPGTFQQCPVGGYTGYAQGGKGQGKGKGPYQGRGQGGKGQWSPHYKGKGRGKISFPKNYDKTMSDMEKQLQKLKQECKKLASQVQVRDVEVEKPASATLPAPAPPKGKSLATKPTMYNAKGQMVEVSWICPCGQPHWSSKVKACVQCKKERADSGAWARVPGEGTKAKEQNRLIAAFATAGNLTWFQQMGLLMDEDKPEDSPDIMDLEEGEASQQQRAKAEQALKQLQEMQADPELIKMAQEKLDSLPKQQEAKPSQVHWDMAKVKRIQAQLVESHNQAKIKNQSTLSELQEQAKELQSKIQQQQQLMEEQEQKFQKLHEACAGAITLKQKAAEPSHPASQAPTATQVTSTVLAAQLKKAEADSRMEQWASDHKLTTEQFLGIIKFAYSGAITGAVEDDAAQAQQEQQVHQVVST
jgi:hypothetical protein